MSRELYPYCPKAVNVYWDNGEWVAVIDQSSTIHPRLRNVAGHNCQTKRQAILDAREFLDLDNSNYED